IADVPWETFLLLGAVVLALTGAEALYADMGHYGRTAIRRAWFIVVLPGLVLCYFGQGAVLLADPKAIKQDRKSGVTGKSWSVRLETGGGRFLKKKKQNK